MSETTPIPWEDACQVEIDRLLAKKTVPEVISHAIHDIISGRIVQYQISVDGPVNCSVDPASLVDFGERLLQAAIAKATERLENSNV